jgi:type I restriction enzyme S subunit
VNHSNSSGGQANISPDIVMGYPILLPPIAEQHRIASILSSLDDKIELNRKINANLEAQAQALFKSWFVDFEPFKDQPFVESELGMIPEGWRVGTLGEIGEIVGGSTPPKAKPEYYTEHGIAWLTPKDLSISNNKFTARGEIDITQEGYDSCSTKLMPQGSVLFSSRAPIGYITIAKNDICTNQGFKSIVPKLAGTAFIYHFLKTSTKEIENKATGSTFKEASGALMKSLQLIIAPQIVLDDFEEVMKPILREQEIIEDENSRLASLRDTLLPRLMSGELKVNEVI